jgi:hypothetical protein
MSALGRLSGRPFAPWPRGLTFFNCPSAGVRPARLSGRTPHDRVAFLYQQLPPLLRNGPIETRVQVLKKDLRIHGSGPLALPLDGLHPP